MLPTHDALDNQQNNVARALYDNIAESPDELAFRKGDLLTVVEKNTCGIEGWWLCSLRGRQGICPGNRLRLVTGNYDIAESDMPLQNLSKRRSWHVQPNMVLTPHKFGDIYLYDHPPGTEGARYDVPPSQDSPNSMLQAYDVPRVLTLENQESKIPTSKSRNQLSVTPMSLEPESQCYDIPRPLGAGPPLTPSSSASSLTAPESLSLPNSNRSSVVSSAPEYDIPKSRTSVSQFYDIPAPNPKPKELPLELSSALETLNRLQSEAGNTVQKLLGLVTPTWRKYENLQNGILEMKLTALRLRTALHELSEFCEGALGNAHKAADKSLVVKLRPLSKALYDADRILQETCNDLDNSNWNAVNLSREEDEDRSPDSLDRLVACARSLTEDVRRAASFLQGNAPLLFRKEVHDDYDYVNLDSKDTVQSQNSEIRNNLPVELQKHFDVVVRDAELMSLSDSNYNQTEKDDSRLLSFYGALAITHTAYLTRAIDAFLQTVEHNQPPKIFLAHGKFVVLSAHRLVHVGDTVARNLSQPGMKCRVQTHADNLSSALAQTVERTKRAAQHFPSVSAVQDMVDAVVDVSHLARDLKMCLVSNVQH